MFVFKCYFLVMNMARVGRLGTFYLGHVSFHFGTGREPILSGYYLIHVNKSMTVQSVEYSLTQQSNSQVKQKLDIFVYIYSLDSSDSKVRISVAKSIVYSF